MNQMTENVKPAVSLPSRLYYLKAYLRIAEKLADDKGVYDPDAVAEKMKEVESNWVKSALSELLAGEACFFDFRRHIYKGFAFDRENDALIIDFCKIAESLNNAMSDEFWRRLQYEMAGLIAYLLRVRKQQGKSTSFKLITSDNEKYRSDEIKPESLLNSMFSELRFSFEEEIDDVNNIENFGVYEVIAEEAAA